ncbi:hypothetical protein QR680_001594 [Steinernema hermaphroditum]|uniref:Uncharacterized protein n=1 Tax=Steinernema hermaphroditum TaxID=289476 RepID=A0AA39LG95_9BILA|nr:hypothetical protein QR680_001594 [Steinernema hermaphroditum]
MKSSCMEQINTSGNFQLVSAFTDEQKRRSIFEVLESKERSFLDKLLALSTALADEDVDSKDVSIILKEFSEFEEAKHTKRVSLLTEVIQTLPGSYREIGQEIVDIEGDASLSANQKAQQQLNVITHSNQSQHDLLNKLWLMINGTYASSIHSIKRAPERKDLSTLNYMEILHRQFNDRRIPEYKLFPSHTSDPANGHTIPYANSPQFVDNPFGEQNDDDLLDTSQNDGFSKVNVFVPRDFEFGGEVSRFDLGQKRNPKTTYIIPFQPIVPQSHSPVQTQIPRDIISPQSLETNISPANKKQILEERFRIDRDGRFRGFPANAGPITAGYKEYPANRVVVQNAADTLPIAATIQEKFQYESKKAQGSLQNRFTNLDRQTTAEPAMSLQFTRSTPLTYPRPYIGPEIITGSLSRPYNPLIRDV